MRQSKYLKKRPLPIFSDKNYNDGFQKGYEHAIEIIKRKENEAITTTKNK
jgi:hypothetical protein